MEPELSIITPAYNEEKRLPPTLDRVAHYMREHYRGDYELIIVDDGSKDTTPDIVREFSKLHPQARLLRFEKNRGYGAVVRDGMLAGKGNFVLVMDADGSVGEEAIIRFLEFMKSHPDIAMTVGSRTVEGARILTPQPILRVGLGYIFLFLARVFFGWPLEDRINGFKMFRRQAAQDVFLYQREDGFLGAAEIVYILERRGWKYELLPILWTDYRDSRIRPARDSWHSFWGLFRILKRDWEGLYTKELRNTNPDKSGRKYETSRSLKETG